MKVGEANQFIRRVEYFIPRNKNNKNITALRISYPKMQRTILYQSDSVVGQKPIKAVEQYYTGAKTTFRPDANNIWRNDSNSRIMSNADELLAYRVYTGL